MHHTKKCITDSSDIEGVKFIVKAMNFHDDVAYGKSKIFIRSPQTLFQLEEARDRMLPGIIVFMQKMWRGGLARRRAKFMRAIYFIMMKFRKYKLRQYILSLVDKFRNVRRMKDYGKSIEWPKPPTVLEGMVDMLLRVHHRWRANMILKGQPKSDWPELRLKTVGQELLRGQRPEWGYRRKWEGNYLALSKDNSNTMDYVAKMNHLKAQDKFTKIIFSCMVKKINKHSKPADRSISVTDKFIYKLDPKKKFKPMRKGIPMSEVTGITVSPGKDQLVAIHLSTENDLVVCLQNTGKEERVGEFVGTLGRQFQLMNKQLKVQVLKPVICMLGGKRRTINIRPTANNGGSTFQKDGVDIALLVPESG